MFCCAVSYKTTWITSINRSALTTRLLRNDRNDMRGGGEALGLTVNNDGNRADRQIRYTISCLSVQDSRRSGKPSEII